MSLTSPITNFESMRAVLNILYDKNSFTKEESLDKQFIADKMNKRVASVTNALAMLKDLEFVSGGHRYKDKKVFLLNKGKSFIELIRTDDKEKIAEFSKDLIKKSKSKLLRESYKLLKRDPQMPYNTLGKLIRKKIKYEKEPMSNATYTNIGRAIKDTFCGLELIDKDEVRLRRNSIRERLTNKLYAKCRANDIFETIEKFGKDGIWQIDKSSPFDWDKQKVMEIARVLNDLDIARYINYQNNILKLTKQGQELKNNLNTNHQEDVFQSILLAYNPVSQVVKKLLYVNREISSFDVGNIVNEYNKTEWKYRTKIGHGCALISWLKEANILVNAKKQGIYIISDSFDPSKVKLRRRLDWSLIDDKQFEDLCCDLLESFDEFENVKKMGGGAGELKRDITATQKITTRLGTEYIKWLVQCKHYLKRKVNPDDLSGLTDVIPAHESDGVLVITSNELTPGAKRLLEKFDTDKRSYKAKWLEKHDLEKMLEDNERILKRYFPPLNSELVLV